MIPRALSGGVAPGRARARCVLARARALVGIRDRARARAARAEREREPSADDTALARGEERRCGEIESGASRGASRAGGEIWRGREGGGARAASRARAARVWERLSRALLGSARGVARILAKSARAAGGQYHYVCFAMHIHTKLVGNLHS